MADALVERATGRSAAEPETVAVNPVISDQTLFGTDDSPALVEAPIRHRDHAQPRSRGGPTAAVNGLGMCEHCNYSKESPGWCVRTQEENGVRTAEFVTPTGARYRSTAPPLPGPPTIVVSDVEVRIGVALAGLHAA
jgi:hypothetical protein